MDDLYEQYTGNTLSTRVGCALSEQLSHMLKFPRRWNGQTSLNNNSADLEVLQEIEKIRSKIRSYYRSDVEITVKIFLGRIAKSNVQNSVQTALKIFDVSYINKLILSAQPYAEVDEQNMCLWNSIKAQMSSFLKWRNRLKENRTKKYNARVLKNIWHYLEELYRARIVLNIGLGNISLGCFKSFYKSVAIPPAIYQLSKNSDETENMNCKKFCYERNIDVMDYSNLMEPSRQAVLENSSDYGLDWVLCYNVVGTLCEELVTEGFIIGVSKSSSSLS